MIAEHDHNSLLIARTPDTSAVRNKVEDDIAFLTARIQRIESHPHPNPIVLKTYQELLNSRIAVLKWLLHGVH